MIQEPEIGAPADPDVKYEYLQVQAKAVNSNDQSISCAPPGQLEVSCQGTGGDANRVTFVVEKNG